jgi:hypothetical protein
MENNRCACRFLDFGDRGYMIEMGMGNKIPPGMFSFYKIEILSGRPRINNHAFFAFSSGNNKTDSRASDN